MTSRPGDGEWDAVSDLVVIGSGGAGLCAALAVRRLGGDVLVIEKQATVGGSTGISGGALWAPDNALMRADGIPDSEADALAYLDATVEDVGASTSRERKLSFLRTAPKMIDFLRESGIELIRSAGYTDYYDDAPGGRADGRVLEAELYDRRRLGPLESWVVPIQLPLVGYTKEAAFFSTMGRTGPSRRVLIRAALRTARARLSGAHLVGSGAALVGRMLEALAGLETPIWREASLSELIVDPADGRVTGVVVQRRGKTVRVKATRGVLLASGGFAHSEAMRERFSPVGPQWTAANPGDTGEAMELAMAAGAGTDLMDQSWWALTTVMPDGSPSFVLWEKGKPHSVMVDHAGRRFVNEAGSYHEVAHAMLARGVSSSEQPVWLILDARHRQRYLWGITPPHAKTRGWVRDGYFIEASSIEGLAERIGVAPAVLSETVTRFNGFAASGVDLDFHRGERAYDRYYGDASHAPNPCLGEIAVGPFYAVAVYPGDTGTAGGLATDADHRVLDTDGAPIPGLYGAGNVTASVMGRGYPGSGASISAAFVGGYRAAHHAMGVPA
jgi:3-oxosteroid 1-dehydrogenase